MNKKCSICKHYNHEYYECDHEKMDYDEFHDSFYCDVREEKTKSIFSSGNNFAVMIDRETCRSYPIVFLCINPDFCCKYFETEEESNEQ